MNYPITRTQMTMPGTSGGIKPHLSFDTGEAEMWRAVGQVAQAGLGTAQKIYLLQAEQQFMNATLKAEEEITRMAKSLETNLDETTYHKELQKSIGTVQKYTPKNPLAAKDYNNWVKKQTPEWQAGIDEAFRIRVVNKWKATELELIEKYKQTGNGAQLFIHENTGIALGYQSRDAALKVIMDTTRISQRVIAENISLGSTPEIFLEKYKTYQDLKVDYPALYPGDFQDLRSMAQGQQRSLKQKEDEVSDALMNDVLSKAQTMDIEEFRKQLRQTVGINEIQRTKLMNTFINAQKLWQDKGVNYWVHTKDYKALTELMFDIEDGKVKSYKEINERWLSDDIPQFSFNHMLWSKNLYDSYHKPSKGDYSPSHEISKMYFESLANLYMDNEGKIEERAEYVAKRIELENALKENWGDAKSMDAEYQNITDGRKKEKAKGILSRAFSFEPLVSGKSFKLGTQVAFGARPLQFYRGLSWAGRNLLPLLDEPPVQAESLEDIEKLKSGTKFIYQGKEYTRK